MAENCTIYCKINNRSDIEQILREQFSAMKISSPKKDLDSLNLEGKKGSLRISFKVFRERGDEFCRLILTTLTHVESNMNGSKEQMQVVLKYLEITELILGVVVEPSFDVDERYDQVVFAIAGSFEGIIFTGSEMLDAVGEALVITE